MDVATIACTKRCPHLLYDLLDNPIRPRVSTILTLFYWCQGTVNSGNRKLFEYRHGCAGQPSISQLSETTQRQQPRRIGEAVPLALLTSVLRFKYIFSRNKPTMRNACGMASVGVPLLTYGHIVAMNIRMTALCRGRFWYKSGGHHNCKLAQWLDIRSCLSRNMSRVGVERVESNRGRLWTIMDDYGRLGTIRDDYG
jgi:hypothetical protein